jgi:hypothetical protein
MNNTGCLTIENPHQRQLLVRCYAHLTEADHCQILSTELTVIGYDAVHIALVDRAQQEAQLGVAGVKKIFEKARSHTCLRREIGSGNITLK